MSSDYELKVVCKSKKNNNGVYKTFEVDGVDTIGVEKNEPFELRFKNNTNRRVQVRLSVDGTDILTGEVASTKSKGKMWMVEANSSMSLEAWPENDSNGARFLFGSLKNSVAVHTHGNLTGKGVIGAAVYTDAHSPVYLTYGYYGNTTSGVWHNKPVFSPTIYGSNAASGINLRGGAIKSSGGIRGQSAGDTFDSFVQCSETATSMNVSDVAVGAGEQVEQKIATAAGLTRPVLDDIVQVRYELWDVLSETLKKQAGKVKSKASPNPFPGDSIKGIDLKKTPRPAKQSKEMVRFA